MSLWYPASWIPQGGSATFFARLGRFPRSGENLREIRAQGVVGGQGQTECSGPIGRHRVPEQRSADHSGGGSADLRVGAGEGSAEHWAGRVGGWTSWTGHAASVQLAGVGVEGSRRARRGGGVGRTAGRMRGSKRPTAGRQGLSRHRTPQSASERAPRTRPGICPTPPARRRQRAPRRHHHGLALPLSSRDVGGAGEWRKWHDARSNWGL